MKNMKIGALSFLFFSLAWLHPTARPCSEIYVLSADAVPVSARNFDIEDALADLSAERYRVVPTPVEIASGPWELALHFYLHDASGASAIVEFLDGKLVVTRDPPVAVLTNSVYAESVAELARYGDFHGELAVPGSPASLDRFVRGAFYKSIAAVPGSRREAVDAGFAMVQLLSIPLISTPAGDLSGTQWTVVTDIAGRRAHFRTARNPQVASVDLRLLSEVSHLRRPVRVDLMRTDLVGDITRLFLRPHGGAYCSGTGDDEGPR